MLAGVKDLLIQISNKMENLLSTSPSLDTLGSTRKQV